MTAPAASSEAPLPRLRQDIEIQVVAERGSAFPSVLVTDLVRGTYFRLSWPQSGAILLWNEADTASALVARVQQCYGVTLRAGQLHEIAEFVAVNQLSEIDPRAGWQTFASNLSKSRRGVLTTLAHNYLFFRVPLLHPDAFLKGLAPRLAFVFQAPFWLMLAALAGVAIYLATRQWTSFAAAATSALALEGLITYGIALLGLKAVHELGHALTTVHFGCKVPSMGAAFMLGAPVLYTDTSDSWRLSRRGDRLAIVFAGVAAEAIVAVFALLAWVFLPDGIARNLCFALATGAVVMSLFVNLNPFMRLDGYFALSDALQVPNLQSRAFALATWRLRELLFKFDLPAPEAFSSSRQRILITYAMLTWIYRLFLYLGIVAVVYVVAGKAIGIVLALFEIIVFIGMPIADEVGKWWSMRNQIRRSPRAKWTATAIAVAIVAFLVPWIGSADVAAVLTAKHEVALHVPASSQLVRIAVRDGDAVQVGDILFEARSPDLERQLVKATLQERQLLMQVARLHASERERDHRVVIERKLDEVRERLAGLWRLQEQLTVRAPFDGRIVDLDPEMSSGLWVGPKHPLARIVSEGEASIRGLISEEAALRIVSGARGIFIPDDATAPRLTVTLQELVTSSDGRLPDPSLSDRFGGPVATGEQRGEHMTRQAWQEVVFRTSISTPVRLQRGIVKVDAERISPAHIVWRQIGRVLVREQAF